MKKGLGLLLCLCIPLWGFARSSNIKGEVVDVNGAPIPFATVQLLKTFTGTTTQNDGTFHLQTNAEGTFTLSISCVGYEKKLVEIELGEKEEIIIMETLVESESMMGEVTVAAKSKATQLREESYAVEVMESETFKNLAVNANEILSKVPGVNIRQSGGFGEDAVLSLNGLKGSQVRIFIDGIPMEYFGSSLSLNNFPANIIEQIEVYKGVVPIHLSADALGGAVNMITNKSLHSFLDASYSYGSFNTHKAAVNAQYRAKKSGFTTRLKSFYNASDNNYKVDIRLWDATTGKTDEFTTEVEHFHDAYNSKMGWLQTGFTHTSYADELMLGVLYSDNYNETQQPVTALGDSEQPYGEVFAKENKVISTLNYAKNNLLTEGLNVSTYLVYFNAESVYRNISSYVYNWLGNKTLEEDGTGERDDRKTYLTKYTKNVISNINAEYGLGDHNNLAFNYTLFSLNLHGEDPYNGENNTRFGNPIAFNKQVLATSYTQSFFDNKFRNTAFVKYYRYTQKSIDTNYFGDDMDQTSTNYQHLGYGLASSYFLRKLQLKVSLEHAVRFPDDLELYGDGVGSEANPYLLPEESNNYNLGAIYKSHVNQNNFICSVNGFVRDSKKFIFAQREGQTVVYRNLDDVLTSGVDFSSNFNWKKKLNINLAATYIYQVNNDRYNAGGKNSLYKERIPNEPYAYGNMTLSYVFSDITSHNDNLAFNVNENYTYEFDYRWSNLGFSSSKYKIPTQYTTDMDVVYSLHDQKYNFSFGVMNVFDADTYDNLYQQNPGRSYHIKFRYFIH